MSNETLAQSYVRIGAVVVFYWIISITMVFVNKRILSGPTINLNAPIFVTFFQCTSSIVFSLTVNHFNERHHFSLLQLIQFPTIRVSWRQARDTLPLTFTFVGMIVFNNLCLQHVQIAFYFVGRSLSTVFNVIFTYVLLGQRTSLPAVSCCALIIVGFVLGCDREQLSGEVTSVGIAYGLLASIFVSLNSICAKRVLPKLDDNVWLVNFYNNLLGFTMFVPLIGIAGELETLRAYDQLFAAHFWAMLLLSAMFAYLIAFASVLQIKMTSPLTHNISGTFKACIQTLLAVMINFQEKEFLWWLSNALVIFGSMAYTRVRQLEMKERAEKDGKSAKYSKDEKDVEPLLDVKSV
jgi:GDP-fucose transporter C1